jgi:hypothetical protein
MEEYIAISRSDFYLLWVKTFTTPNGLINMSDICIINTDLYLRLIEHGIPSTWYVNVVSRNLNTGGFGWWVIWRKK